ncbi:MAG: outer membrane beta-barrel protein [Candidatus Omnitrophota bacterium]
MKKAKLLICLGGMIAIIFGMNILAFAKGNIHVGRLEINPFVSLEEKYDSNIYLEPENLENQDWITTTSLGCSANMPLVAGREDDFLLKLRYKADLLAFHDETALNRAEQAAGAEVDLNFANDFSFKLDEDFQTTADPPNTELTSQENRMRNSAGAVIGYERESIKVDLRYRNIRDDYKNLDSLDKFEHITTLSAYYQLFSKTAVLCEYNYGTLDYDVATSNSDSVYSQFRVGVKGDIAPKLTGLVKVGYKATDYDEAGKKDFASGTLHANLKYDVIERSTLKIYAERSSVESSYSTNSYYAMNKAGLNLDYELKERLLFIAGTSYQFNKYPDETTEGSLTKKRTDDILNANIGLRYQMWEDLSLETGYEYKQRDSDFAAFDYVDHKFFVKASLML